MEKFKKTDSHCTRCVNGIVFTPFITTKKGKRVYKRHGTVFAFPCRYCLAKDF